MYVCYVCMWVVYVGKAAGRQGKSGSVFTLHTKMIKVLISAQLLWPNG